MTAPGTADDVALLRAVADHYDARSHAASRDDHADELEAIATRLRRLAERLAESPSSVTPRVCEPWCGTEPDGNPTAFYIPADRNSYCTEACRDAGRALAPASAAMCKPWCGTKALSVALRTNLPATIDTQWCSTACRDAGRALAPVGAAKPTAVPPVERGHCNRCDRCGWPLRDELGACRPGDCSMRPLPTPRDACAGCGAPFSGASIVGAKLEPMRGEVAEGFHALVSAAGPLPTTGLASAESPPVEVPEEKCGTCGGSGGDPKCRHGHARCHACGGRGRTTRGE